MRFLHVPVHPDGCPAAFGRGFHFPLPSFCCLSDAVGRSWCVGRGLEEGCSENAVLASCRFKDCRTVGIEAEAWKSCQYKYPPHKPSLLVAMNAKKNDDRYDPKYRSDANKCFHDWPLISSKRGLVVRRSGGQPKKVFDRKFWEILIE